MLEPKASAMERTVKKPGSVTAPRSIARIVPYERPASPASLCWLQSRAVRRLRISLASASAAAACGLSHRLRRPTMRPGYQGIAL